MKSNPIISALNSIDTNSPGAQVDIARLIVDLADNEIESYSEVAERLKPFEDIELLERVISELDSTHSSVSSEAAAELKKFQS